MPSISHQSVSQGLQLAVQEDLVYALATGDIDFADCPPSLIWLSVPVEVRSSIEMCPSLTENQHMEAGGDALLGKLMFDLLIYWCPDAPTSFIAQAQCILTTNKTLAILAELANTPTPSEEGPNSLIHEICSLKKRPSELPLGVVKKRADQFGMFVQALFDEKGTMETIRLLESCLKPVIVYVIARLTDRKKVKIALEARPLPLRQYEDGDMKNVVSHWAYKGERVHKQDKDEVKSTDDAGYEGESETEAADVLSDSDSENESRSRGIDFLSSDDLEDSDDSAIWGVPLDYDPVYVYPAELGSILLEASKEIRRPKKSSSRIKLAPPTFYSSTSFEGSQSTSLPSSWSLSSASSSSSVCSALSSLSSSTSLASSMSLSAFASLIPSSSTSAFPSLSLTVESSSSARTRMTCRTRSAVYKDDFPYASYPASGKRKRTPSAPFTNDDPVPRKSRLSGLENLG